MSMKAYLKPEQYSWWNAMLRSGSDCPPGIGSVRSLTGVVEGFQ
jgi:hypothetical protein